MKILMLALCLIVFDCSEKHVVEVPQTVLETNDEVYVRTVINGLTVELRNHQGSCTISYRPNEAGGDVQSMSLNVGMSAPCNFVRLRSPEATPQKYFYGKGDDRWASLLITGGKPDKIIHDNFQPDGCGTEIAKIRVYSNRIEIAWSGPNGVPSCPSEPQDEVMFAS